MQCKPKSIFSIKFEADESDRVVIMSVEKVVPAISINIYKSFAMHGKKVITPAKEIEHEII